MDFNDMRKDFKKAATSGDAPKGESEPAKAVAQGSGSDLCPPGEKWCVIEFARWGNNARILYCARAADRFTAKRIHRGIPVFLRAELKTLATAVAGQSDEEADSLFRRMYQMKKAAMSKAGADVWITGMDGGTPKSNPNPPADLAWEMKEYTATVRRIKKAMVWYGENKGMPLAQAGKVTMAFMDLLSKVADLAERVLTSGREMSQKEILRGFAV